MVSCVFMAAVSVFSACEQEAMVLGALGANARQLNHCCAVARKWMTAAFMLARVAFAPLPFSYAVVFGAYLLLRAHDIRVCCSWGEPRFMLNCNYGLRTGAPDGSRVRIAKNGAGQTGSDCEALNRP
eukprot:6213027-Pleurochrysis_carterae.AAC.2